MKTLFLPLFSETEPSEAAVFKQTLVVVYLAILSFLLVPVPFTLMSGIFLPPTALKNSLIAAISFILFFLSVSTRNFYTPWRSISGVFTAFGFASSVAVALAFHTNPPSYEAFELLSLSLLFYSTTRLCTRRPAVSYVIFLIFLLSGVVSSITTVVDAIIHSGEAGTYPFSEASSASGFYSAALTGTIALILVHPRFGTLMRYSTLKLLPIIIAAVVCALGLVATRSQDAFLALFVGTIIALSVRFQNKSLIFLCFLLLPIFAFILWAFISPISFWNSSFGLRLLLWKDTLKLGFSYLPQGCSIRLLFAVFPQYASESTLSHPLVGDVIRTSQSAYLDIFATTGLLAIPLVFFIVVFILRLFKTARQTQESTSRLYSSLYLPVLVTFFVFGFFDSSIQSYEVAYVLVLLCAAASSLTSQPNPPPIAVKFSTVHSAIRCVMFVLGIYLSGSLFFCTQSVRLSKASLFRQFENSYTSENLKKVELYADKIASFGDKDYHTITALYKAGSLALKKGIFSVAQRYFEELLKTAPNFSATRYNLFRMYILLDNKEEAVKQLLLYLKTAAIPPQNWSFLAELGDFLFSKGELELAAQIKERARRLHSAFQNSLNR